jgi:hypothetical protein
MVLRLSRLINLAQISLTLAGKYEITSRVYCIMEEKPFEKHFKGEAKPQELNLPSAPQSPSFGLHDSGWSQNQWFQLLQQLVQMNIVDWKDITALVLGHLNPSQVGTSLASSPGFKSASTAKAIEWDW